MTMYLGKNPSLFTMHELLVTLADMPIIEHVCYRARPKNFSFCTRACDKNGKHDLDADTIKKIEPI